MARADVCFPSRKINVWSAFITVSPYLGPLLAAFMITKLSWRWPFWIYTIETGLCLIGIILFLDETYYDRRIPIDKQPPRQSRLLRLVGIEQYRSRHLRNTFLQAIIRPVKVILKPTVLISTIYFLFTFAWVVGINTTLSIFIGPLYKFGPKQIGKRNLLPKPLHSLTSP
jgi:MFS family permease